MGWDSSTKTLTQPFTKIAANGNGDLQKALGTSSLSHIRMMTGLDGYINPLAIWKPFQSSTVLFGSVAERRNAIRRAGAGFRQFNGATYNHYPIFNNNASLGNTGTDRYKFPHGVWTYYRPVTGTHPLRAMDFAPGALDGQQTGYKSDAVSPVYVEWPNLAATSQNCYCLVYVGYAAYGPSGGRYNRYTCISFDDIFPTDDSYYAGFHFALLISNQSTGIRQMVVSPTKVSDVSPSNGATISFANLKDSCTALQNLQINDVVNFCICLVQYNGASSEQAVETISGSNNWNVTSLEIAENSDRESILFPGNGTIAGMSITHNALYVSSATSPISGYNAWKICDNGHPLTITSVINSAAEWGTINGINGKIRIEVEGSPALLYNADAGYGSLGTFIEIPYTIGLNAYNSPITQSYIYGNSIYGYNAGNTPFTLYALKQSNSAQTCKLKVTVSFTYDTTVYSTTQETTY